MARIKGGFRRGSRSKLTKSPRNKGKISIRNFLQSLTPGEKVILKAEPAIQGGLYHPRFHGRMGEVVGLQGDCYLVSIMDKNKKKHVVVHPIHLKKKEK